MTIGRAAGILGVWVCVSCGDGSIDATKFVEVDAAARALESDLIDSGGTGSAGFGALLKRFHAELSALEARTRGRGEEAVLDAYVRAYDNYQYFLRFKLLEQDAVSGMVLLRGRNRAIASRYRLAMQNRGGGRWVNREDAMKVFSDQADREVTMATNLLGTSQRRRT
jgi:hypothetical protein